MSNKSVLAGLLNLVPESMEDSVFPELTIPDTPTTVEGGILANAKASIEIVRFLNSYAGIKHSELYGMVGGLAPTAQAIAAGFLQSDGTDISAAISILDAMKIIGDDASGGGITGSNESLKRREDSGGTLSLLATLISYIPAISGYSALLTPVISTALEIWSAPGRIGEEVGLIIFNALIDLAKQIIINELYPDEGGEIAQESLKRIADALLLKENEGMGDVVSSFGYLLQSFEGYFTSSDDSVSPPVLTSIGEHIKDIKELIEQMADEEWVTEYDGRIIAHKLKTIDEVE